MTRLYILRHANAASALPGMRDFDRPLEAAGIAASIALGARLVEKNIIPEIVFCSPALRTRQTFEALTRSFPVSPTLIYEQDLYSEGWPAYLQVIRNAQSSSSVMIVGHNPSCEEIVHKLVGEGEKKALQKLFEGFAPGTLAVVNFTVALTQATHGAGYLESVLHSGRQRE
jgi:phosphohistidine phosphatase